MGYTRNFGMRSFENVVRNGRFRVPPAGAANAIPNDAGSVDGEVLIGTAVVIDPDNPGFVRRPTAGQAPGPHCGLVVYEHIQWKGTDPALTTSRDFETVPNGQYVQIMRGPGTKVWFKNTTAKTLYDGRSQPGRELVDADALSGATPSLTVGDYLTVTADGTFVEGTRDDGWFIVEQIDGDTVECRFTF